jgi:UDP-N-acetylglucosamine pyrophosphorylase
MTSWTNFEEQKEFWASKDYFGLGKENVIIF